MTAFWRAKIAEQRRERCALQLYFYQQKTTHRRPPDYGPQRSTSSTLPRQRALFFLSPSSTFADVSHTAQNSNTRCCYMKRTNEREKAKANEKYKCRHLAIWNGMSTLRTRNEKRTNISAQCGKKRKKYKIFCASRSGLLSALGVFYGAQAACFSTTYGNFYSIIFTGGASLRSPPFARCCWALCSFEKKNVSTWKTEIYILFFIMKNIAEWIFINTLAFFASLFACLCSTAASESFNSGAVFSLDCSSFSLSPPVPSPAWKTRLIHSNSSSSSSSSIRWQARQHLRRNKTSTRMKRLLKFQRAAGKEKNVGNLIFILLPAFLLCCRERSLALCLFFFARSTCVWCSLIRKTFDVFSLTIYSFFLLLECSKSARELMETIPDAMDIWSRPTDRPAISQILKTQNNLFSSLTALCEN